MPDATIPKITLGRREFAVPEFTVKQLKSFLPKIMRVGRIDYQNVTEADLEQLIEVLFEAVSRRDPAAPDKDTITREQFDDLPISMIDEMVPAIPIISQQAGLKSAKPESNTEKEAGADAAADPPPSGGTT